MTGIFQIFGWHKGRKNGSKNNKNNNNDNDEPGPKANPVPIYYMFHDPARRGAYGSAECPHEQAQISRNSIDLQRASIDNSEVVSSDSLSILSELQRVAEQKLQVSRLSLDSKPKPYLFPNARDESPHRSSKFANEQAQQSYDTASLFETSTFSRDSVSAKHSSKEGWNLPPRDMRGVSPATKRREKLRVPLENSREPDSVDTDPFDPKASVSLQNVAAIRDHAKLAQQWRKDTQSEEDPRHSNVSRDLHQPSPIRETGQFFAESSHAAPVSQSYKESIRANEIKDSCSQHSSEKSWRDSSRRSVEASQGNPADIRELAKLAQEWRRVSKAIVRQDPHHAGISGDLHRSPIVNETGKHSSENRLPRLQDFEEAMRTIDFMDSQETSEEPSRDASRNSVEWSPHSTADIRDLARLAQQWRKGPQLSAKEDLSSRHSHRSSSAKETGYYSMGSNQATRQSQDFQGAMRAIDLRDSQDWRDTSRNSVEGRDEPCLSSVTSHLSVDSRKYQSSTPVPSFDCREEPRASSFQSPRVSTGNSSHEVISRVKSSSMMSNSSVENRRRGQSVVARLMGLEMLPPDSDFVSPSENTSSRMGKSLHNLVNSTPLVEPVSIAADQDRLHNHLSQVAQQLKEFSAKTQQVSLPKAKVKVNSRLRSRSRSRSSSPAAGQHEGDLYKIEHRQLHQKVSDLRQQEEKGGQKSYPKQPMSPKHLQVEAMPFVLKKSKKGHRHSEELLYSDMDQQLHQLCLKNAIQERKTLRQILEAMYLKGLLHQPRNKDILSAKTARMQPTQQESQPPIREVKQMPSSMAPNLARLGRLDLEYQDILEFQNMRKEEDTKVQKEPSLEVNHSGEASIVVMKPLGHQITTPIPIAISPLRQTGEVENMPSWGGSRKSTVTLTPHAGSYREKSSESSESSSNEGWSATGWPLNRSKSLGCNPLSRPNPQFPSDHYNSEERVGGLRNPRRVRRKARVSSKFAELDRQSGLNSSLSVPPLHGREQASRGTVFPDARAYFKSASGILERETLHEEDERPASENKTKSRAPVIALRSPFSDYGLVRSGSDDEDTIRVIGNSRLEGNPDSSYPQRAFIRLPSASQEPSGKVPLEVDLLQHRRKSGKSSHSRRKTRSSHALDMPTVVLPTKATNLDTLNSDHTLVDAQRSHMMVDQATPLETSESIAVSPLRFTPGSSGAKPAKVMEEEQESQFMVTPEVSKPINQVEIQELSEELSLLKQECIEEEAGHLDDGTNHASPVSVLETVSFQEEESSLSPKSVQSNAIMHDEGKLHLTETDRPYNMSEAICSPVAEKLTLFGTEAVEKICEPFISQSEEVWALDLEDQEGYLSRCDIKLHLPVVEREERVMNAGSYVESQSDERAYVKDLLVMSGLTEEVSSGINANANKMHIDDVYTETEDHHFQLKESTILENGDQGRKQGKIYKQGVDQHLLFDCVNEILRRRIEPFLSPQPWGTPYLGRKPAGQQLIQEVWEELQDLHCPLVDAYDALYAILQKDYTRKEFQWLDFSAEIGEVGFQLADMILEEIVEAAVQDVTAMCTSVQKPLLAPGWHDNGEMAICNVQKPSPPSTREEDDNEEMAMHTVQKHSLLPARDNENEEIATCTVHKHSPLLPPKEDETAEIAMCTVQKHSPLLPPREDEDVEMTMHTVQKYSPLLPPREDENAEMAMCTVQKHSPLLPPREDENAEMAMYTVQKHSPLLRPREDENAERRRKELVEKTKRDLLAWRVQYQEV